MAMTRERLRQIKSLALKEELRGHTTMAELIDELTAEVDRLREESDSWEWKYNGKKHEFDEIFKAHQELKAIRQSRTKGRGRSQRQ